VHGGDFDQPPGVGGADVLIGGGRDEALERGPVMHGQVTGGLAGDDETVGAAGRQHRGAPGARLVFPPVDDNPKRARQDDEDLAVVAVYVLGAAVASDGGRVDQRERAGRVLAGDTDVV
jgi:hypothetical protein